MENNFCVHIDRICRNYLKTVLFHCELKNNYKVKKTIAKMAEPPENGVRMFILLTEVDFSAIYQGPIKGYTGTDHTKSKNQK